MPPTPPMQPVPPADEVCRRFTPSPPARRLLRPGLPAREFLALLVQNRLYADAVRFLAHCLSPRRAVWWGCVCARRAGGDPLPPAEEEALRAAVHWVLEPTEEHRRAAEAPARAATVKTPAGCVAHGAVWSGGSITPPDQPPVPPKPFLTARVVAGGILIASTRAKAGVDLRHLLAMGLGVAIGEFDPALAEAGWHGPV